MASPPTRSAPKANGTVIAPTLHAAAVTPMVGGVVLMFVAVGMVALAIGAFSGFATLHDAKRQGKREPR